MKRLIEALNTFAGAVGLVALWYFSVFFLGIFCGFTAWLFVEGFRLVWQ